jgi:SagB-type dehydrogenase family enzyme
MIVPAEDATSLSLLYHLNSEPWPILPDSDVPYEVEAKRYVPAGEGVALPAAPLTPLRELLERRGSCRSFERLPLSLADLAAVLAGTYGIARHSLLPGGQLLLLRTVPSAGALYPLEIYVATQAVMGLGVGLYHYNVGEHTLELMHRDAAWSRLREVLLTHEACASASALVILTAVFARSQKKYGPRGYRYVLLEAGHAAQNLCLTATERGLGALCLGGFVDTSLNRLLGLEPRSEGAIYAVAVGHPQSAEAPPQLAGAAGEAAVRHRS